MKMSGTLINIERALDYFRERHKYEDETSIYHVRCFKENIETLVRKLCRQVVCIVVTAYFVQKFINDLNVTEMIFKSNFWIVMTEFLMLITCNAQFKIFFTGYCAGIEPKGID